MSNESLQEGLMLGMGNPLLDISNSVTRDYLCQYELKDNDAILAESRHSPIFNDLSARGDTEYIPGGATLNAIRVAQWLLRKPQVTVITGCIQKDKFGQVLEEKCAEVGVKTMFQYNKGSEPTGKCAVLIVEDNRSLVTELASANCFTMDHLEIDENWKIVTNAKFFYSAAFFLTVCPDAMLKVAKHAHDHNKLQMMNLSAPFLVQFFKDPMLKVLPYVDVIFGNETEAAIFAEVHNFGTTDVKEIAKKIADWEKANENRPRQVVITCGDDPVIVATHGSDVKEFPVKKLSLEEIVDTNGAGDAFVGGFVSQLVLGKSLDECVQCGIVTAQVIICRSGCTFPNDPSSIGY